jgi:predicted nuclease of predicted toxin-antitoxin system
MRFYLDDDVTSPRILEAARHLGIEATGSDECGLRGADDAKHWRFAATEARCVVTRNYGDFSRLTQRALQEGTPHAGVLFVPSSLPNEAFGAIARALKAYADAHPDGLPPYMIDFLPPAAD